MSLRDDVFKRPKEHHPEMALLKSPRQALLEELGLAGGWVPAVQGKSLSKHIHITCMCLVLCSTYKLHLFNTVAPRYILEVDV